MANEFVGRNGIIALNNSQITGSLSVSNGITGSLFGTASQSISASYAYTASSTISSSYAYTASSATNAGNALTASYVVLAQTASYVINAQTASYFLTSSVTSASYAFTASSAISSSYAFTASSAISAYTASSAINATNALTASSVNTINSSVGNYYVTMVTGSTGGNSIYVDNTGILYNANINQLILSGSLLTTGSIFLTGSINIFNGGVTSSLFGTSSQAISASYAFTASSAVSAYTASSSISSSYAFTASSAISAYTASSAISSSYAITASYLLGSIVSASYAYTASSAISSSYAITASYLLGSIVSASYAYTASSAISSSYALTASYISGGIGVTQIIPGTNITISPVGGTGAVTINSSGGGGSSFPYTGSAQITGSLSVTGSNSFLFPLTILQPSQSAFFISQSISQSNATGSQVYGVNIQQTFYNTTSSQSQTALRILVTFTGSITGSATTNKIVDFGARSAGSQLTLTDQTSGSIFQVNDVSGLPIIEATSDWTVNMYNYPNIIFRKSGSNVFLTGSLFGSASYAITASYALNGGGGGVSFPYSGSAAITGSLIVTGSTNITGSLNLQSSGTSLPVLSISGSSGSLLSIYDNPPSVTLMTVSSGSINVLTVNTSSLIVTGALDLNYNTSTAPFIAAFGSGSTDILTVNTGSVVVSGSLLVSGSTTISGSLSVSGPINGNALISASAGGVTNNVSQLVFSNSNNVSFGINGSTITATVAAGGGGAAKSYFEYIPLIQGSTTVTLGGSSNYVQPFILPYDVSISYMRMPITVSFGQTSYATTANTSAAYLMQQTFWANIYSLGTGASSRTLQQVAQASATMAYAITGSIGAASNNQTITQAITIPAEGGYNSTFATNYNTNLGSQTIVSSLLTLFNGVRALDLLMNTSLPAGAYWMAIQRSTAQTTAVASAMTAASMNYSQIFASQISNNMNLWGANATAGSNGLQQAVGVWTTNTNGAISNSMAISQISTIANNPRIPFQFIRQA